MSLPTIDTVRGWQDLTLVATDGSVIGRIESIYVDRETRQPEWVLVRTGPTGSIRMFVPIQNAAQEGDTVRVPHQEDTIRTAPGLDPDGDLSEDEEARLYGHYGVEYSTAASPSGLPAGEADASSRDHDVAAATGTLAGARGRLTRHQDAPAAAATGDAETVTPAATARGAEPPAGSWTDATPIVVTTAAGRRDAEDADTVGTTGVLPEPTTVPQAGTDTGMAPADQRPAGRGKLVKALAGAGAAAAVGSVVLNRRRQARRRPRGLAAALVALGLARPPRRRGLAAVVTRKPRPTGVAAALSSAGQALGEGTTAARQARQALGQGASGAAREARNRVVVVRRRIGRRPATRAGRAKATALAVATAATVRLRRRGRRRNRAKARRQVAARLAGARGAWAWVIGEAARATEQAAEATRQATHTVESAAESARGAPAVVTRKLRREARRADVRSAAARTRGRMREALPRRQRRSRKMGKVTGRLGLALGAATGYVLGAKAGRERYEQIVEAVRRLTERPQVKRIVEQAPSTVTSTVEQVADKAADKVRQAGDRVAAGSNGAPDASGPRVDVRDGARAGRRGVVEDPVPPPALAAEASKAPNPAPEEIGKP